MKKDINFYLLAMGNFVSRMGTAIFEIALGWWIVEITGSSRAMGYILAASLLPIIIIGPINGVLVDRWNRKKILVISDIISGVVSILIGLMAYYKNINIPILIISSFILGICSSIFKPALKSMIPQMVDKNNLVKANSVLESLSTLSKIIGPVVGGIILSISFLGVSGAFILNGISFLISGISEVFIKYEKSYSKNNSNNIFMDLKFGLSYINNNRNIKISLLIAALVNMLLCSFAVLLPLYVQKIIKESSLYYSYVVSSEAVGGIIVAILLMNIKNIKFNIKFLILSVIVIGSSLTLTIFAQFYSIILIISAFFIGAGSIVFNTMFNSYVQEIVNDELQGRVFSIIYMIVTIIVPISYLIYGFLGDYILSSIFMYSGVAIILCSMLGRKLSTTIDNIDNDEKRVDF